MLTLSFRRSRLAFQRFRRCRLGWQKGGCHSHRAISSQVCPLLLPNSGPPLLPRIPRLLL